MKQSLVWALSIVAGVVVCGASQSAVAQAPGKAPAAQGAAEPSATSYDFEDDLVTGDLVRPDGELLSVRRRGNRASLIQIREHFVPEMLKSVEDL